jgi:hypothetical protein
MLAFSLADVFTDTDPCTPGSSTYDPNDALQRQTCALLATGVTADTSAPPEIVFEPDPVTRTCAPGYVLQNGACYPALSTGPASADMAASLTGIGWKPIAITAGVLGLVYVVARVISKRKARG